MLQSERSFLGDKSVPWDTGCARRFLLITDEQKKILESIPGWTVEETEKGEKSNSEGEKIPKIQDQSPPTEITSTRHAETRTCDSLIPNSNHLAKESGFNSDSPSKENSAMKNTFMQSISLYANKVVNMFSRRRSNSLSDIDYAKFDGDSLTHSKSETNLEDDYRTFRSSDEMTCEKLDTRILNHPYLNGAESCSETSVFPSTDGSTSRKDLILSKKMELLEKRFSLPKENSLLLIAKEIGIGSNFGITVSTEQETKDNGLPKGLVVEENSLLLHAEEIRRKTNFEKESEENGLPKGLIENSLLLHAEEIRTNLGTTTATEEESGLLKGFIPEENSLLLHAEEIRNKINFRIAEEETEENGLSKALAPKQNSLLLLTEEIKNKMNFTTTVSKSENNQVFVSEGQGLGTEQQSICLPDLVCDNNLKNSSNVLFDETVASSEEMDKVCTRTVENNKSIENISEVPMLDSGCNGNETNSMILQDEDSLPSIESILSTKIQENQIQAEKDLKSVTSIEVSQNCEKTTVETDDYQSCGVTLAESTILQIYKKIPEHQAEKKSAMLPNNDYFLKTIVADTENSHGNSNNDYFSKTIVADTEISHDNSNSDCFLKTIVPGTENSHSNSNNLLKIIVTGTENSHSNSNNDYFSKTIVADTENSHSNCVLENYSSASGKVGGKRKRLSKDIRNPSKGDKPFDVVDTEVVADTENSHSNCVLENYSAVMNNSASGKLGGKRKRLSKDNINPSKGDKPFDVVDTVVVADTENSHSNCVLENYSAMVNNSASGKLGGKRKRQSKDNKPRKKSFVHSRVIIQYTADEVNNIIQLMKEFQKKVI